MSHPQLVILIRTEAGTYDACWQDGTGRCNLSTLGTDPETAIQRWNQDHDTYPTKTICTGTHTEDTKHPNSYHPCARTDRPCPIRSAP